MFKIEFDTDNAAFYGEQEPEEIARILRDVAQRVMHGATGGLVRDVNGNTVGTFKLGEDTP